MQQLIPKTYSLKDMNPDYPDLPVKGFEKGHHRVPAVNPDFVWNFDMIRDFLIWERLRTESQDNLVLTGPTGCGKTERVEQWAAHFGIPCWFMAGSPDATLMDVRGYNTVISDGAGGSTMLFIDGPATAPLRAGGGFLIVNEADHCGPLLQGMNDIKTGWEIPETEEVLPCPTGGNFGLILTMNTNGTGDHRAQFSGAQTINSSVMSRSYVVECDYLSKDEEVGILQKVCGLPVEMLSKMQEYAETLRKRYKADDSTSINASVDLRVLRRWAITTEMLGASSAYQNEGGGYRATRDALMRANANAQDPVTKAVMMEVFDAKFKPEEFSS